MQLKNVQKRKEKRKNKQTNETSSMAEKEIGAMFLPFKINKAN